jgi:hypothetical protein
MELGTAKRKAFVKARVDGLENERALGTGFAICSPVQTVQSIDDGPYVLFCAQPTIHE